MANTGPKPGRGWLCEQLNDDYLFGCRGGSRIAAGESAHQRYEVWDTPQFGRLYRLDGRFMASEADEFFYHENLVHFPAVAQATTRRALVIGGGDGGSLRELVGLPGIERIVLVELDEKVLELARQYLPRVHCGAFDDPRVEVRIDDGRRYVEEAARAAGERFDLIVFDLTDPDGIAAPLYTVEFLRSCRALLSDDGAVSLHLGAPIFQRATVRRLLASLRSVFRIVRPYFLYVPLYGSLWGMACASDALDPAALTAVEVDSRLAARGIVALKYYNGDIHCAQQALPNYLRALLG